MLKRVILITLAICLLLTWQQVKCPIDNSGSYFTGETRTAENGKLMRLYKCASYSHEFWVVGR